jgi:hypothetical protein
MLKPRKKIHIFYKHIHSGPGKNRPSWFTHEACFLNLLRSIEYSKNIPIDIELNVLFDGTQESYESDFIKKYYEEDLAGIGSNPIRFNLQIFEGGSQRLAGLYLLDEIKRRDFRGGDYVYILENDYLHNFNWIYYINQLISSEVPFDYISLYDHSDKYPYRDGFHEMHANLMSRLYVAGGRHWRTVPSTCYSFIVSVEKFNQDLDILSSDLMDHQVFAELEGRGRSVLSPIPGLATHCMTNLLSPCIEWKNFLQPPSEPLMNKGC